MTPETPGARKQAVSKYYKIALIATAVICVGIIGVAIFGGPSSATGNPAVEPASDIVTADAAPPAPVGGSNATPPAGQTSPLGGGPADRRLAPIPGTGTPAAGAATPPGGVTTTQEQPQTVDELLRNGERQSSPAPIVDAAPPAPAGPRTYAIRSGDVLSRIAEREYGDQRYWVDIARANPSIDPNRLSVGATIRLPAASEVAGASGSSSPTPAAVVRNIPAGQKVHYVRSGETLYSIARQHYRSTEGWHLIYSANRAAIGSNPNQLKEGMQLVVPAETPMPR